MKKILALTLAGVMLFALMSCTGNPKVEDDEIADDVIVDDAPATDVLPGGEEELSGTPEAEQDEIVSDPPAEKPAQKPAEKPADKPVQTPEQKPEQTPADTVGASLLATFRANKDKDIAAIADACLKNEVILFSGAAAPVEPGYLAGFDEEISGFDSAVMFAPMIGTIPFVGYVFESSDANALAENLKKTANLRWNICTEAEQMICEVSGNKVFFLMCPKSLAE